MSSLTKLQHTALNELAFRNDSSLKQIYSQNSKWWYTLDSTDMGWDITCNICFKEIKKSIALNRFIIPYLIVLIDHGINHLKEYNLLIFS